jgi:hypothetical protein
LCATVAGLHGNLAGSVRRRARWNDYVETAAADDADALLDTRSLYEIVGLDREGWTIVGIDFSLDAPSHHVVAYAVGRALAEPLSDEHLPVTAFHLGTSARLHEFLREVFKRVSVRLLSATAGHRELLVAEHRNLAGTST